MKRKKLEILHKRTFVRGGGAHTCVSTMCCNIQAKEKSYCNCKAGYHNCCFKEHLSEGGGGAHTCVSTICCNIQAKEKVIVIVRLAITTVVLRNMVLVLLGCQKM